MKQEIQINPCIQHEAMRQKSMGLCQTVYFKQKRVGFNFEMKMQIQQIGVLILGSDYPLQAPLISSIIRDGNITYLAHLWELNAMMFIISSAHNPAPSKCRIKCGGSYEHIFPVHTAGLQHPTRRGWHKPNNKPTSTTKLKDDLPKRLFQYSSSEWNHTKVFFFPFEV